VAAGNLPRRFFTELVGHRRISAIARQRTPDNCEPSSAPRRPAHEGGKWAAANVSFVLEGTPIETEMWIANAKPNPQLSTWWLPGEHGTAVALDIFGVLFAFIEAHPLPAEGPPGVIRFWLGDKRTTDQCRRRNPAEPGAATGGAAHDPAQLRPVTPQGAPLTAQRLRPHAACPPAITRLAREGDSRETKSASGVRRAYPPREFTSETHR
jgi:hypothetical protein